MAGGGSANCCKQAKRSATGSLFFTSPRMVFGTMLKRWKLKLPQPGDTSVPIAELSPFESAEELGVKECVAGGTIAMTDWNLYA